MSLWPLGRPSVCLQGGSEGSSVDEASVWNQSWTESRLTETELRSDCRQLLHVLLLCIQSMFPAERGGCSSPQSEQFWRTNQTHCEYGVVSILRLLHSAVSVLNSLQLLTDWLDLQRQAERREELLEFDPDSWAEGKNNRKKFNRHEICFQRFKITRSKYDMECQVSELRDSQLVSRVKLWLFLTLNPSHSNFLVWTLFSKILHFKHF